MGGALYKNDGLEAKIELEYRSIRRYMDEVYGDITVVQSN